MSSKLLSFVIISFTLVGTSFCQSKSTETTSKGEKIYAVSKPDSEWQKELSPEAYEVLRKKGTEYAFTGKFYDFKEKGVFICAACGNELFDSNTKYNSGSGWPSFYQPVNQNAVDLELDTSLGEAREEVLCSKCGGHLGHVFNDGPKPTGLRYCVNSVSMDFKQK
jgi:peptide-methionine (R)-S-oxide reductase